MLLIRLSLRNLLRQKRRNILLGSAMTIGVAILVTANSFSRGVSDIMFNKIMRYVTGHVAVRFNERGGVTSEIFRDRERILPALKNEPLIEEFEEAIGVFARAIGNKRSDNIILVSADTRRDVSADTAREMEESFRLIEGSWKDLESGEIENPAVVSAEKARYLNLKRGDTLRVRFRNMFGQDQAARLTVAGIMKNDNIFMQPVVFVELRKARELLGFRPWELGSLSLKIVNPRRNAHKVADSLHSKLKPGLAAIRATVSGGGGKASVALLGLNTDDASKEKARALIKLSSGSLERALRKDGVMLPAALAARLGAKPGTRLKVSYGRKYEKTPKETYLEVSAVCSADCPGADIVLLADPGFYDLYYEDMPSDARLPELTPAWAELVSPEWILLKRSYTTDDFKKKYQDISKNKWKGTTVDVSTMYETASDILKLESVLNIITVSAVVVLFFIILLGVVNTLRMTIRERTREIGTLRAIGMSRGDVRAMFLLETFFLSLFASAAGVALAFLAMKGLSSWAFHPQDNPLGMLLVNSRLYFLPTFAGVALSVLLILLIAVATAWFPATRAAKLPPAKALGHFG